VSERGDFPSDVVQHAEAFARRLSGDARSFADAISGAERDYDALLNAVARLSSRMAFDRAGRPAALAAVREALPLIERDLLDAIVEDHACEVAAVEEALYQLALAYGRRRALER
jgi:hypothetical protein